MIDETLLASLKCATPHKSEHFLNSPKMMSCGHMVCIDCVQAVMKCSKCDEINQFDLNKHPFVDIIKTVININLNDLVKIVYEKYQSLEQVFTDESQQVNAKLENKVRFLASEIELRVESMKAELDKFKNEFIQKIEKAEADLKKKLNIGKSKIEIENGIKYLENKSQNSVTIDGFYEYNRKITDLNEKIDEIKAIANINLEFRENNAFKIDASLIGMLQLEHENLISRIETQYEKIEKIELPYEISHIIEINDANIVIASKQSNCLAIYDANFKLISECRKIESKNIKPNGLCFSDLHSSIFVSNLTDRSIIKMDSNLNKTDALLWLRVNEYFGDICYSDNKLYACIKRKILVIDALNLRSLSLHYLREEPIQIRIINKFAFIEHPKTFEFYNIENFQKNDKRGNLYRSIKSVANDDIKAESKTAEIKYMNSNVCEKKIQNINDETTLKYPSNALIAFTNTNMFFYFDRSDASLTAYDNYGKFVQDKQLNYNLKPFTNDEIIPMAVISNKLAICSGNTITLANIQ